MLSITSFLFLFVLLALFPTTAVQALASAATPTTTTTSIVTGANGYVGRAIVHELLLQQQQQPHETADDKNDDKEESSIICLVRPHRIADETAYWDKVRSSSSQDHPPERLVVVMPYDMLDGGLTLRAALDECSNHNSNHVCVYHVASVFGPTDDHKETALQNVEGTRDVLETVHRWRQDTNECPACKVVVTSSMAAVRGTGQEPSNGRYYTAEDWNTVSELGANWGASYQWSKMESERQATQLAKQYNIPLVTLCPSFVFGPPYGGESTSSFSIQLVRQWARGESPVQSRLLVDVRDAARAHVVAGRRSSTTTGRWIVSTDARVSSRTLAEWIRDVTAPRYRDLIHSDDEFAGGAIPIGQQEVDAEGPLLEALGIKLRSIQETMQDMTVRLLQNEMETTSESTV